MSDSLGKIPVLLTATQLDLLGEALMERIPQIAARVSKAAKTGATSEELALLKAYLDLAKLIMDRNNAPVSGERAGNLLSRISKERINGPSPLQSPALHLRQP